MIFFADFVMRRLFLYSMMKYAKKYDEIGKKSQRLQIEVDLISASLAKLDALKNYVGFLITKIWQILKRFYRALT